MFKSSNNFTTDEIFRLYEQSEFSDIINGDKEINKKIIKLKKIKNKFCFLPFAVSAGALAGAISFFTIFRKLRLF
jgi:hypothetical protein